MQISDNGIALILKWEDFHRKVITDHIGIKTVGIGHTTTAKGMKLGQMISPDKVWQLFVSDMDTVYKVIDNTVKVELTQYEFDAICSFIFNVGGGNFSKSTMLKLINSDAPKTDIARQFLRWTRAGGKVAPGLVRRRQDVADLFLNKKIFV